jgi:cysteine desulfurase
MIYLDYQATTPLAPEAREAMLPWLGGPDSSDFGNPHSPHRMGRSAGAAIEYAREQVAGLLPPGGRVIFTGSACEAINLAMRGIACKGAIAVSAMEHAAVIDTARALGDCTIMPVDREGIADTRANLPPQTALVCLMQVNNEIGTVQPVDALAERAHAAGALVLCDAVQGAGKLAPPAAADMIAISAHKLYGPKGIGALWVRDGVELTPQITGGLQEGLRSGTLSPALCAGFGAATALAKARMEEDAGQRRSALARQSQYPAGRPRCRAADERLPRGDVFRRVRLRQRIGKNQPRPESHRPHRPTGEKFDPARFRALHHAGRA